MNTKIKKTIYAGILGTAVMSVLMAIMSLIGFPKMSPPNMLSEMLGLPVSIGWLLHFVTGIIFAFGYTYVCFIKNKINNVYLKGAAYGMVVFVFAQIMLGIMGTILTMPPMDGSMAATTIASILGHIVFGITVAKTVGDSYCATSACATKN